MTTTYFLNSIMGNVFGSKTSPALPTRYYVGLSKTAPNINGTGVTEPSSSAGYARIALDMLSEPVDGAITNNDSVTFDESISAWGTVTHFVIYDAETGGNLLMYDALTTPRAVEEATVVIIKKGSLNLTLANPA